MLFTKSVDSSVPSSAALDFPLLKFSDDPRDWWRVRQAVEGVIILGGIGSGKTSGSGRKIAEKYLQSGFGGLVLCAKPGEAALWEGYANECGRGEDLIFFGEGSGKQFNFLEYEMTRKSKGGGQTINITDLFMATFKMGQRISGSEAGENNMFWENALKRCLNRVIDLLKFAGEEIRVANMVKLLTESPTSRDTFYKIKKTGLKKIPRWGKNDYFIKCLYHAEWKEKTVSQERHWNLVVSYFLSEFATLDPEVRSNIKESFLGYCEPFQSEILDIHFSQGLTIRPEDTFEGKIIILDFSVKEYLTAGLYAQFIFKNLWQQAVERREVTEDTLPVFLWVDESQYFVNEYDTSFQTTARSSKACTVFLTQNISNFYAYMGGKQVTAKVDSLLANLSTKIFHSNNDAVTNRWASQLIGDNFLDQKSTNTSRSQDSFVSNESEGRSQQLLPQVLPLHFTQLLSGGDKIDKRIQAVMQVRGFTWADGKNHKWVEFERK